MSATKSAGSTSVLYVQYTNPAGYPPIVHGAGLLVGTGATVRAIGIDLLREVTFPRHDRIHVELLPQRAAGWRQRLAFALFVWHVCVRVAQYRPRWIYASDALSAPSAWIASRVFRIPCVYHEHDAPEDTTGSATTRAVAWFRRRLAREAACVVVPSAERAAVLTEATGRRDVEVIWNTPTLSEVAPARTTEGAGTRLLFHGSIVPARVPETLLHALAALPDAITLRVTGYDPSGGHYRARLIALGQLLGIAHRVEFAGPLSRVDLMRECSAFDVGITLLPLTSASVNERTMVGASNKPFDYLAGGLALLTPDLPDWRRVFVESGLGLACDPSSVDSVAQAVRWFHDEPDARRQMGERGRQRVLAEWNYDRQFRPVVDLIAGQQVGASTGAR